MLAQLGGGLDQIEREQSVRVVILACSGLESSSIEPHTWGAEKFEGVDIGTSAELAERICNRIDSFEVPVVATLRGIVAGRALHLALACHLRVAATNATLDLAGIDAGGGSRLAQELGAVHELPEDRKTLSADEAKQIGLVNRIVDEEHLLAEASLLADQILELAPLAIRACLTAVTRGLDRSLKEGLELESNLFSGLFGTNDVREGTIAFLDKRRPSFTGT
ncbi:MAG TPA: enoyl-CoA hydratase-related protein [Pyrinomonadaceae bacterium]